MLNIDFDERSQIYLVAENIAKGVNKNQVTQTNELVSNGTETYKM
jgi:hypothetical protein